MESIIRDGITIYIPQEICGLIIHHWPTNLTKRELINLCLVSNGFCAEARHLLYSAVFLTGKDIYFSFCNTVIRRPILVESMQQLVLVLPLQKTYSIGYYMIKQVLNFATHLCDLRILCDPKRSSRNVRRVGRSILEGHKFKLTTFVNTYFEMPEIVKFLASQPTIETFVTDQLDTQSLMELPLTSLRNLRCAFDPADLTFLQALAGSSSSRWTVERLQLNIISKAPASLRGILESLGQHLGQKLRSLSLVLVIQIYEIPIVQRIVRNVAVHLPRVKFLELICEKNESTGLIIDINNTATPPNTSLHTLLLHPPTRSNPSPDWTDVRHEYQRSPIVTTIMNDMPSLNKLILVDDFRMSHEYLRYSDPISLTPARKRHRYPVMRELLIGGGPIGRDFRNLWLVPHFELNSLRASYGLDASQWWTVKL